MHGLVRSFFIWLIFLLSVSLVIPSTNPFVRIPSEIFSYMLPVVIVWLLVRREGFVKSVGLEKKNLKHSVIWVLALFFVFIGIVGLVVDACLRMMGLEKEAVRAEFENYLKKQPNWYRSYLLVGSFFPIAFSEELVFRGFIQADLAASVGSVSAILLSSFLHAALHFWYFQLSAGTVFFLQAFLFFIWFGVVRHISHNISGCILMHGLINVLSVLKLFGEFGLKVSEMLTLVLLFSSFVCVLLLFMGHLRKSTEERIRQYNERKIDVTFMRLERMRNGLKHMLSQIRMKYRRGEMRKEDFLRLKSIYERRIAEVEKVLSLQKGRLKSA